MSASLIRKAAIMAAAAVLSIQDKDAYGRVVHLQPMTWTAEGCR